MSNINEKVQKLFDMNNRLHQGIDLQHFEAKVKNKVNSLFCYFYKYNWSLISPTSLETNVINQNMVFKLVATCKKMEQKIKKTF